MRKFFSNKKLIILMIVLIITMGLIAVSLKTRNDKKTPLIQRINNDMVGVVGRVVSVPINTIKYGIDDVINLTNTYQENIKLKSQLNNLNQLKATNQTLKSENYQLKSQLNLNNKLNNFSYVNASVMFRSPSNWQNLLIINRGSDSGIQKNMSVLSESGLIGRIIEVNSNTSKVELISTNNKSSNRFSAQVNTGENSVINGLITGYNQENGNLILGQISDTKGIKKGQQVVTSGLGGYTPKGLLIGTVDGVESNGYGLSKVIEIKPAEKLNDINYVTVIKQNSSEVNNDNGNS